MGVFGLTGNPSSGKTTVLKLFKDNGAVVFDCDKRIHEYYRDKDNLIYKKIKAFFPKVLKKGVIRRDLLGKEVFFDKQKLKELEDIVHPTIKSDLLAWINKVRFKKGIFVAEVPLLFEKKLESYFDGVILVLTSVPSLIERLIEKYSISQEQALKRLSLYLPASEKIEKADFIINNNLGFLELKKEVNLLWKKLK
ncbi:MAG: dephospho-CoA kinase [Candidatus Omnitrophica bacterium]|jgi:dephospho-CoA kinase|nr:dephospho-CoA kinase [Candidatus Omnitrophota bacterium]